jgi:hypothetical protein
MMADAETTPHASRFYAQGRREEDGKALLVACCAADWDCGVGRIGALAGSGMSRAANSSRARDGTFIEVGGITATVWSCQRVTEAMGRGMTISIVSVESCEGIYDLR